MNKNKDIEKLDVKNPCDLVDKEMKGKFRTNNPSKQQIKKYKKHGSELIKDKKVMYFHEDIIMPVIMHSRIPTKSINLRSKLGLNQYDIILTKEQSVLKSVMDASEVENMKTQYRALECRIDLYFYDYKLAIEVDEKGHKDRNIDQKIKIQMTIEKEIGCEFNRINPDEENFNIFRSVNEIHRHIKKSTKNLIEESTKKSLIDQLSNKLLRLELKSSNSTKTKCLKYVVEHVFRTL